MRYYKVFRAGTLMAVTTICLLAANTLAHGFGLAASHRPLSISQASPVFPHYRLTDLGTLPEADSSGAYGLDNNGDVVGEAGHRMGFVTIPLHPILYHRGQVHDLGLLPGMTGGIAVSINSKGEAVGMMECLNTAVPYRKRAFVWREGTLAALPSPHGYVDSTASGINAQGQVVGEVTDAKSRSMAALWQREQVKVLGSLPSFGTSVAEAVNHKGQIAGYVEGTASADAKAEAFLYEHGKMRALGRLGGDNSNAHALNESGWVVGESTTGRHDDHGNPVVHPFLWRRGHKMLDLGSLGGTYAEAYGVNDRGQVVGSGTRADSHDHAFLWQRGVLVDLNTLIPPGTGWVLAEATAINDHGKIAGTGVVNGHERAFLLTPR